MEEVKEYTIDRLLQYLNKHYRDRGIMADLRHGLNRDTEYRAWQHIVPFCNIKNEKDRNITLLIAGGWAILQKSEKNGNFGKSMRDMAVSGKKGRDVSNDSLESFSARFRRLLNCTNSIELCQRLPNLIRMSKNKGVGVNFRRLFWDLKKWGKDVKYAWASVYWSKNPISDETVGWEDAP